MEAKPKTYASGRDTVRPGHLLDTERTYLPPAAGVTPPPCRFYFAASVSRGEQREKRSAESDRRDARRMTFSLSTICTPNIGTKYRTGAGQGKSFFR